MEGVAESETTINKRLLGLHKNSWTVFMCFQYNRTWSVLVDIVILVEYGS